MRIVSLDWQLNTGSLSNAGNAQRRWSTRQGLLVRIHRHDGVVGMGEASPLPGYSQDDLTTATRDLHGWSSAELPATLDLDQPLEPQLTDLLDDLGAPSARCAVETALLDLVGQTRACPMWSLLTSNPPRAVPLCGLISTDQQRQALQTAARLRARGVGIVKIKIGRPGALDAEIELIRAVRATGLQVRLDANGGLPAASLPTTLERLRALDPRLIEEPAAPEDLLALFDRPAPGADGVSGHGFPLGLDETLQADDGERWIERLAACGALAALVVKPMALGGPLRCMRLARRAADLGVGAIASHLFDGPIALAAAAHLALALSSMQGSTPLACGLDRHPGLDAWPPRPLALLTDQLLTERGIVAPDQPGLGIPAEAFQ